MIMIITNATTTTTTPTTTTTTTTNDNNDNDNDDNYDTKGDRDPVRLPDADPTCPGRVRRRRGAVVFSTRADSTSSNYVATYIGISNSVVRWSFLHAQTILFPTM